MKTRTSLAAALLAFAVSTFAAGAASGQAVTIRAYDSKGKDTGKCLSGPPSYNDPTYSWRLANCAADATSQRFTFNAGGQPNQLSHLITVPGGDGAIRCAAVLTGKTNPGVFRVNTIVATTACTTAGASILWKFSDGQIIAADSPAAAPMCLTFNSAMGPSARLGDCKKPETLTRWAVTAVK